MEDTGEQAMAKGSLPFLFGEALKAGQSYVRSSIRARDSSYRMISLAFLAHLEGQKRPRLFKQLVESRLGRPATKPEEKRPFLLILHALLGQEDDAPRNAICQFSKMVRALELIEHTYADVRPIPKVDELIDYIKDAGGIGGLYDLSRVGESGGADISQKEPPNVVNLKPNEISIPLLGAHVTKVGRGYRLRLSEWRPGKYQVLLHVGKGGFVEAIVGESTDSEDAA